MDAGIANRATVTWSENQERYELALFEAERRLHKWILPAGFTSPAAPCTGSFLGIEEINSRLSEAHVSKSAPEGWQPLHNGGWERSIKPPKN